MKKKQKYGWMIVVILLIIGGLSYFPITSYLNDQLQKKRDTDMDWRVIEPAAISLKRFGEDNQSFLMKTDEDQKMFTKKRVNCTVSFQANCILIANTSQEQQF